MTIAPAATTTTTTTTAPAAPAAPANLFRSALITALVAAVPTTEVDPAKLSFPDSLRTSEDRRLYALCMSGFVGGEAGIAWRKRHAMEASGLGYWRWSLARASLFGSSVPSEALEAERESRRLLESRRLRYELSLLTDNVGRIAEVLTTFAQMVPVAVAAYAATTPADSPARAAARALNDAAAKMLAAPPPSSAGVVVTPAAQPATTPAAPTSQPATTPSAQPS